MARRRGNDGIRDDEDRHNDASLEKIDYATDEKQLNASITEQSANDAYELEYDPVLGVTRRRRKSRKKAYQLNQLDHNALIWKRWRKRILIGGGLIAAIQGLLMATVLGVILGALGMASGTLTLIKQFKGLMKPFTDQFQNILQFADKNVIPLEQVEAMLRKKLVCHLVPKQLFMYAMITLFGRGMGSTWLGVASLGIGIAALPGLYESAVAIGSGLGLLHQGIEMAMPQIRQYQHLFQPEHVEARIRSGLEWYKDHSYLYQQIKAEEYARGQQLNQDTLAATMPLRTKPRREVESGIGLPPINLSPERLQGLVSQVGKVAQQVVEQTPLDEALMAFAGAVYQR